MCSISAPAKGNCWLHLDACAFHSNPPHTRQRVFPQFFVFPFWQRWQNTSRTPTEINMLSTPVLGKLANCHSCSFPGFYFSQFFSIFSHTAFPTYLLLKRIFLSYFQFVSLRIRFGEAVGKGVRILGCFMAPVDNCNKNVGRDYNKRIMSGHAHSVRRSVGARIEFHLPNHWALFRFSSVSAFLSSRFAMSCAKCQLCLRAKVFDFSFSVCGGSISAFRSRSLSVPIVKRWCMRFQLPAFSFVCILLSEKVSLRCEGFFGAVCFGLKSLFTCSKLCIFARRQTRNWGRKLWWETRDSSNNYKI